MLLHRVYISYTSLSIVLFLILSDISHGTGTNGTRKMRHRVRGPRRSKAATITYSGVTYSSSCQEECDKETRHIMKLHRQCVMRMHRANLQNMTEERFKKKLLQAADLCGTDDICYSQSEAFIAYRKCLKHESEKKNKRKERDVSSWVHDNPDRLWDSPIKYSIIPIGYTVDEIDRIDGVFNEYTERTCLDFIKVGDEEDFAGLVISGSSQGCWSHIGRSTQKKKQPINLYYKSCTALRGVIFHEVAHALGVIHEVARPDRDDFVTVVEQNLRDISYLSQFEKDDDAIPSGPYDYTSVMHYEKYSFTKNGRTPGAETVVPIDIRFLDTIGQRSEISFFDLKSINDKYCGDICSTTDTVCARGGYPDPTNCSRCICQSIYSGRTCDQLAPMTDQTMCGPSQDITISSKEAWMLEVKNYENKENICVWHIQAPPGHFLMINTMNKEEFMIGEVPTCRAHWLEIRDKSNEAELVPRFCFNNYPENVMTVGSEAFISFVVHEDTAVKLDPDGGDLFSGFSLLLTALPVPCTGGTDCGENGNCLRIEDIETCDCNPGFINHDSTCVHESFCSIDLHQCHQQALCTDVPGSYTCQCMEGFYGDGLNCTLGTECYKYGDLCDENARCSNIPDGYICECGDDYFGDGFTCFPNIPCAATNNLCVENAVCIEVSDSPTCYCDKGYTGNGTERCTNINECTSTASPHNCHENAECNDAQGSYECACKTGYEGDGFSCSNINECTSDSLTHNCHQYADCTDTHGSFQCFCRSGFQGDGLTCSNIDECSDDVCSDYAICNDEIGSYNCTCLPGYTGDGVSCTNIDECQSGDNDCHEDAECSDTMGSFDCTCKSGYDGNGQVCENVNECENRGLELCDSFGYFVCVDQPGTYRCQCLTGFIQDEVNSTCQEVDECQSTDMNNCAADATCENTAGSFTCTCHPGYMGDGVNCTDVDECSETEPNHCPSSALCFNTLGSFKCKCPMGHTGNANVSCQDINECKNFGVCHSEASCKNTPGGYNCSCLPGYQGDGQNCIDLDECSLPEHNDCSPNATCTNTIGNYICTCKTNFVGSGKMCTDTVSAVRSLRERLLRSDSHRPQSELLCLLVASLLAYSLRG